MTCCCRWRLVWALLVFHFCLVMVSPVSAQRSPDFWDIDFSCADSIALAYQDQPLKDLKRADVLALSLTRNLPTEVEKFRAIFYWITQNIDYDMKMAKDHTAREARLARDQKKLNIYRRTFHHRMERVLLENKRGICAGYAMLLSSMSQAAGINCKTVTGMGRTMDTPIGERRDNHAWNAVQLGNRWYLCDATWASGYYDEYLKKFRRVYNDNYFLTEPSLFVANHYPADTTWMLLLQKPSWDEFVDAPIRSKGYIKSRVNTYLPQQGNLRVKKCGDVIFRFTSNSDRAPSAYIMVRGMTKTEHFDHKLVKDSEGRYFLNHTFEEKGKFLVDIVLNDQYAFRYEVYVK